jgi:hypothetical protein
MQRVCAWCKAFIGDLDGDVEKITHGICETCYARVMEGMRIDRSARPDPNAIKPGESS